MHKFVLVWPETLSVIDTHFYCIFYIYQASEAMSAHKKGLGNPLSSGHKLQSTSKKFEAPSKYIFKSASPRFS